MKDISYLESKGIYALYDTYQNIYIYIYALYDASSLKTINHAVKCIFCLG